MTGEIWKPITGYEGYYEVSNLGRIKSLARDVYDADGNFQRHKPETIKHPKPTTDGYYAITFSVNGANKTVGIHRLVAQAFLPQPNSDDCEVDHINFNRKDNRAENLQYVSHVENVKRSANENHYKHYGSDNPNYDKHTLHDYYAEHPDERMKLARKGLQNGMCKKIRVRYPDGLEKTFGMIRDCAEDMIRYLRITTTTAKSLSGRIGQCAKNHKTLHGCEVEFI